MTEEEFDKLVPAIDKEFAYSIDNIVDKKFEEIEVNEKNSTLLYSQMAFVENNQIVSMLTAKDIITNKLYKRTIIRGIKPNLL